MKQEKIDGLTDGIFAIVMTILVFEIKVPEIRGLITNESLASAIFSIYPLFLSYILSFSLLFTYWRAHHYIASVLAKNIDIRLSNLSALFLLLVCLIPFSSHLLGIYNETQFSIVFFAINTILIGITLFLMRRYVIRSSTIENTPFTVIENKHANTRILLPVLVALISIVVSFFHKELALAFFTLAIVFNLSRRSTRYLFNFINLFHKNKATNLDIEYINTH